MLVFTTNANISSSSTVFASKEGPGQLFIDGTVSVQFFVNGRTYLALERLQVV